jgi:hypothetical protein
VLASTTVTLGEGQEREVTLEGAKPIPRGVSAITVNATATEPRNFAFRGTVSEPQGVSEMIALVERMRQGLIWDGPVYLECYTGYVDTLRVELQFRRSAEAPPVAATIGPREGGCDALAVSIEGHEQPIAPFPAGSEADPLIEKLLGVKFPKPE